MVIFDTFLWGKNLFLKKDPFFPREKEPIHFVENWVVWLLLGWSQFWQNWLTSFDIVMEVCMEAHNRIISLHWKIVLGNFVGSFFCAKSMAICCEFCYRYGSMNVNFMENEILSKWILWKLIVLKYEFCEKRDFENVSFMKNEFCERWYFFENLDTLVKCPKKIPLTEKLQ